MAGPGAVGLQSQPDMGWEVVDRDIGDVGAGQQDGAGPVDDVHGHDDPHAVDDVAQQLDRGEIGGADLVKGARVEHASQDAVNMARYAKKRSSARAAFSAVGRFFMNAAHVVKSVITFDVFRPSWHANNVVHYDLAAMQKNAGVKRADIALPPDDGTPAVPFDKHLVAVGTGFGDKINVTTGAVGASITVKPFSKPLYPNGGHPRLMDIVQNPKLQDCWFLSGITALLSAKGAAAIEQLITVNEDNGTCDVRLGKRHFTVPLGEVQCDGKSCVSDSAPWVKVLEQAAAMYMATESSMGMIYGFLSSALPMLSGGGEVSTPQSSQVTVEVLKNALAKHVPVEIGHVGRGAGFLNNVAGVMRDNISPGHAVTLLDVQDRGGGKAWLTVMDPYGKTRIISSAAIKRCSFAFGCSDDAFEKLCGRDDDDIEEEKLDASPPPSGPSSEIDEDDF